MKAAAGSAVLAPGASTTVTVQLDARSGAPCLGIVELLTDDPTTPVAFVTLEGTVPQGIMVRPERVLFRASKGVLPALKVLVTGPPEMRLGEVLCLAGRLTSRVAHFEANEHEMRAEVELTLSNGLVGSVQDELQIHTTHPERPLITVPVAGSITGDLEVQPKELFWGFLKGDQVVERKLTLRSRSGTSFSVADAKARDACVELAPPRQLTPSTWEVVARLRPRGAGVVKTTLVLTTDVPDEETLEVGVYADVRSKP